VTIEERIIVDFSDIAAIGLECVQCHSKITFDPSKAATIPYACPQCRQDWLPDRASEEYVINRLLASLADYRKHQKGASDGFAVRLEFDATKLSSFRASSAKD